jgi:hypothetical protein
MVVAPNAPVVLFAGGGDGTYAWTAPQGVPDQGTDWFFATSYANTGSYNVLLVSGAETALCNVLVWVPPPPPPPVIPPPTVPPQNGPNLPWRDQGADAPFVPEDAGAVAEAQAMHPPCGEWEVTFHGNSGDADGLIVGWTWLFHDDYMTDGPMVVRQYDGPGVYRVRLTTTDDMGYAAESDFDVHLTECQAPVEPVPEPAPEPVVPATPAAEEPPRLIDRVSMVRPLQADGDLAVSRAPLGSLLVMSTGLLCLMLVAYRRRS